jgi:hypothetical protein
MRSGPPRLYERSTRMLPRCGVPLREWRATVRDIAKLNHQIAEEMGQLAQHIGGLLPETSDSFKLRFMGLTNNMRTKPGQAPVHGPQLPEALDRSGSMLPGPSDLLARLAAYENRSVDKHLRDVRERLDGGDRDVDFMTGEPVPNPETGEDVPWSPFV